MDISEGEKIRSEATYIVKTVYTKRTKVNKNIQNTIKCKIQKYKNRKFRTTYITKERQKYHKKQDYNKKNNT